MDDKRDELKAYALCLLFGALLGVIYVMYRMQADAIYYGY